jgi:hypothetical protein
MCIEHVGDAAPHRLDSDAKVADRGDRDHRNLYAVSGASGKWQARHISQPEIKDDDREV